MIAIEFNIVNSLSNVDVGKLVATKRVMQV